MSRTNIGQMFFSGYVYRQIIFPIMFPDNHAGIHFRSRFDKDCAAVFEMEDAVCGSSSAFQSDKNALSPSADIPFCNRLIRTERMVQNAIASRLRHEFCRITEQSAGWHFKR